MGLLHARQKILLSLASLLLSGCSSSILKHDNADKLLAQSEYDNIVHIKEIPPSGLYVRLPGPEPVAVATTRAHLVEVTASKKAEEKAEQKKEIAALKKDRQKKSTAKKLGAPANLYADAASGAIAPAVRREPSIEDATGFTGRRPLNDPFRVGEKTVLELSYFGVVAGDFTMEVKPFVEVNEHKSYHFRASAISTSVFAMFYAVDDWVETFLDYERMTPYNYSLNVKETKQLRTTTSYFDWKKLKGFYWDKRITKEKGLEEKKIEWNILDYSQNVFSAVYYLRTFTFEPGKSYSFRVAYEGKNMVIKAEVLRRETIETPLGPMKTFLVKPTFQIDGVFSPAGDIFFWLTDDDRKFLVRIESKIKIGKIIGMIKNIEP